MDVATEPGSLTDHQCSDLSRVEVSTFPEGIKTGEFTLDAGGQDAFVFAGLKNVKGKRGAPSGDLVITNSAGGASALRIRGKHGIATKVPDGFGKFGPKEARKLARELRPGEVHTDSRDPASMSFRVRSAEGGFAHVKILEASHHGGVRFRFVYSKLPEGPTGLTGKYEGKTVRLAWSPSDGAVEHVVYAMVDDDYKELARTKETTYEVSDLESGAFLMFAVASVDKKGATSDLTPVTVTTFSAKVRTGTFTLDCFGSNSFDFAKRRVIEGPSGDINITNSAGGASALRIKGANGIATGVPEVFGRLDLKTVQELATTLKPGEVDTDTHDEATLSFRVKSAEGGIAHVRISEPAFPKVTLEYVYVLPME